MSRRIILSSDDESSDSPIVEPQNQVKEEKDAVKALVKEEPKVKEEVKVKEEENSMFGE